MFAAGNAIAAPPLSAAPEIVTLRVAWPTPPLVITSADVSVDVAPTDVTLAVAV
jgi:hypothetical protein